MTRKTCDDQQSLGGLSISGVSLDDSVCRRYSLDRPDMVTRPEIRGIVEVDKAPFSLPSPARGEDLLFPSLYGRGKGRVGPPAVINARHCRRQ